MLRECYLVKRYSPSFSYLLVSVGNNWCSNYEGRTFWVRSFGDALFYFKGETIMEKEKIIDVTGIELTPGDMSACLGNGEHKDNDGNPVECCCDECDYMILCLKNAGLYSED